MLSGKKVKKEKKDKEKEKEKDDKKKSLKWRRKPKNEGSISRGKVVASEPIVSAPGVGAWKHKVLKLPDGKEIDPTSFTNYIVEDDSPVENKPKYGSALDIEEMKAIARERRESVAGIVSSKSPSADDSAVPEKPVGDENSVNIDNDSNEAVPKNLNENLQLAKALFPYEAQDNDEMNLSINEIMWVMEPHPSGWWVGCKYNASNPQELGPPRLFPGSYVELLPPGFVVESTENSAAPVEAPQENSISPVERNKSAEPPDLTSPREERYNRPLPMPVSSENEDPESSTGKKLKRRPSQKYQMVGTPQPPVVRKGSTPQANVPSKGKLSAPGPAQASNSPAVVSSSAPASNVSSVNIPSSPRQEAAMWKKKHDEKHKELVRARELLSKHLESSGGNAIVSDPNVEELKLQHEEQRRIVETLQVENKKLRGDLDRLKPAASEAVAQLKRMKAENRQLRQLLHSAKEQLARQKESQESVPALKAEIGQLKEKFNVLNTAMLEKEASWAQRVMDLQDKIDEKSPPLTGGAGAGVKSRPPSGGPAGAPDSLVRPVIKKPGPQPANTQVPSARAPLPTAANKASAVTRPPPGVNKAGSETKASSANEANSTNSGDPNSPNNPSLAALLESLNLGTTETGSSEERDALAGLAKDINIETTGPQKSLSPRLEKASATASSASAASDHADPLDALLQQLEQEGYP